MLLLLKIGCYLHLLMVQHGLQPELSSFLRDLNSAANSGKNHIDILKKRVENVLFRADRPVFS